MPKPKKQNKPRRQRKQAKAQSNNRRAAVYYRSNFPRVLDSAPIAFPKQSAITPSDSMTSRGQDRIFKSLDLATIPSGQVIFDKLIDPSLCLRMAGLARNFQKIKYVSMKFQVLPQFPTTTPGGYVCGFLADPSDKLPMDDPASYLITNRGSRVNSWFAPCVTNAVMPRRNYFVDKPDIGADDLREYSPGRFVVVCDNPPNTTGYLTIELVWTVVFSYATTDNVEKAYTITSPIDAYICGPLNSSGAVEVAGGTLVKSSNGVQVTTAEVSLATGVPIEDGDCWELPPPSYAEATMTKSIGTGVIATDIDCKYLVAEGGKFLLGAFNDVANKILIPRAADWISRALGTNVTSKPYANDIPIVRSYTALPVGSSLKWVDQTGGAITPAHASSLIRVRGGRIVPGDLRLTQPLVNPVDLNESREQM